MDNILIYQKHPNILDPNCMQKHFHMKFYAANIIFPCIWMDTRQNNGISFLQKKDIVTKIPPPNPKFLKYMQYFLNIFNLQRVLNVRF